MSDKPISDEEDLDVNPLLADVDITTLRDSGRKLRNNILKFERKTAALKDSTLTRRVKRLLDAAENISIQAPDFKAAGTGRDFITYGHSIFCQTSLPYKDPGETREWERTNGSAKLKIIAGEALDPATNKWNKVGLPYGPKARLVMIYLTGEAVRTNNPEIEVGGSLTSFIKHILRTDPNGREIRAVRDQLKALSAASIRIGWLDGDRSINIQSQIVTGFDLWWPKDEAQKVFWPSTVKLSADFCNSLKDHAVALDDRAVSALAHSALALDIYTWMAQRLYRITDKRGAFIGWDSLQSQFGGTYKRIRDFRVDFLHALKQVRAAYPQAKIADVDDAKGNPAGLQLMYSPPPVTRKRVPAII